MTKKISNHDFEMIRKLVYRECGINLSPPKKVLVESRLQKRLSVLKMESFSSYCDYVMSTPGKQQEIVHLIDSVATNKTDFFREPLHFQFLEEEVLPAALECIPSRTFKVWSAACSTGEEPYTAAMVLENFSTRAPQFNYKIIASDISTKALEKAAQAVYSMSSITRVSPEFKKKFLLRSKNPETPTIRIVPGLRSKIRFMRLNLMDDIREIDSDFDVVFCRNVLIYFDRPTQEAVVRKLLTKIRPGGYLFIGHSESVYHMKLPARQLRPTILQKA